MLTVISPAKRLDWSPCQAKMTTPIFDSEASRLAGHARQLSLGKLKSLMDISDDLARLNRERFKSYESEPAEEATRPAIFAFAGDTYIGLDANSLDEQALERAQSHLRILSGLYGVLRPLDAIQPYRLEMGSRLKTRRGKSLYEFWGKDISKALNAQAEAIGTTFLVNCASQEYFGAVDPKALKPQIITPHFFEVKNNSPKNVSFFAKKARGAMARFIVENRVTTVDGLADFDAGGYKFQPDLSGDGQLIFHRDAQPAIAGQAA
ncbi:MAG: peroxide stress protein YaaA [Boseongicola sp.]|nr:MAG: peroxide stress protein YaaA [Boseongicola sp.]